MSKVIQGDACWQCEDPQCGAEWSYMMEDAEVPEVCNYCSPTDEDLLQGDMYIIKGMFLGTKEQFEDTFFSNASLDQMKSFAKNHDRELIIVKPKDVHEAS